MQISFSLILIIEILKGPKNTWILTYVQWVSGCLCQPSPTLISFDKVGQLLAAVNQSVAGTVQVLGAVGDSCSLFREILYYLFGLLQYIHLANFTFVHWKYWTFKFNSNLVQELRDNWEAKMLSSIYFMIKVIIPLDSGELKKLRLYKLFAISDIISVLFLSANTEKALVPFVTNFNGLGRQIQVTYGVKTTAECGNSWHISSCSKMIKPGCWNPAV